jgi:hypothetical protein
MSTCTISEVTSTTSGTVSGTVESTSPINSGKITKVTLDNTSWTAIPTSAAANRQGLGIQNLSGDNLLLNWSNTAPANEYIFVASGAERYYSAKTGAILYGRFQTIATGTIIVEELIK